MEELINSSMSKWEESAICNLIFDIWVKVLERQLSTSVSSRDRTASGPLIRFATSCSDMFGIGSESKTKRKKAAKQRLIEDAKRNRVIEEIASGVIDAAAPAIDDATKRRVIDDLVKGRKTGDVPRITVHAIRQRARRYHTRSN